MKKIIAVLLFLPMVTFAQEPIEYDDKYIFENAVQSLDLIYVALSKKDFQFAEAFLLFHDVKSTEAAAYALIADQDLTQNGIKALLVSGELVAFNAFRNADAHTLARGLELDTQKCYAIQVPSNSADCWFYFDGPTDRLQFFKLRNIRVKE